MAQDLTFTAEVYKVQTLVDGGVRVTLDLPETAIAEAATLMECKRGGLVLSVVVSALQKVSRKNGTVSARSEWQP